MLARHRTAPTAPFDISVAILTCMLTVALALPLVFAAAASAAPGDTIWTRQFTSGSRDDAFLDVARGPENAYYTVGVTRATDESSALALVKYKADGKKLWTRTYQAPDTKGAAGACVAVDGEGDVIVAGTVGIAPPASGKGRDIAVLKYSKDGRRLWVRTYDGPAHRDDFAAGLALDGAGTAYVVGSSRGTSTGQDYAELAVGDGGKLKWVWRYAGPVKRDAAAAVAVDGAGNSYVTGASQSSGGSIAAVTAKISHGGSKVWLKRLQYGDGFTEATALVHRRIGDTRTLFLAGTAMGTTATKRNLLICRLQANTGTTVHASQIDGNGGDDAGRALAVDASGNAYAAGSTEDGASGVQHAFVARLSADGTLPAGWPHTIWVGPDDNEALFSTIALDVTGNPVCGGYALQTGLGTEALVQSFWPTGGWRWSNLSSGSASGDDLCNAVIAGSGGVFAAGQVKRGGSGIDAQLKKIEP